MNNKTLACFAIAFAGWIAAPMANAAPIPNLANTGSGVAEGSVDPGWTLGANAGSYGSSLIAASNNTYPLAGNWLLNDAASKWLVPNNTQANHAAGDYDFVKTFSLAGFVPASASLTFRFAVDNTLTGVTLNGATIAIPSGVGFGAFSSTVTVNNTTNPGVFTGGTNTLRFSVNNAPGQTQNPTGLRVEISGTANAVVVSEANAAALAAFALPLLGAVAARRSR